MTVRSLLAGLLLFVGFELALFTTPYTARVTSPPGRLMVLGIVLAALVWCLWGVVSMRFVAPARLAESTVPHMVAARAIGGASGRVVMGVVVLAGTCATVHALLSAGAHMLAGMAAARLTPGLAQAGVRHGRRCSCWPRGRPMMLAMGMAGEPETEVYARAGVLFWLLHYAAMHLAVLVRATPSDAPHSVGLRALAPAVVALLCLRSPRPGRAGSRVDRP